MKKILLISIILSALVLRLYSGSSFTFWNVDEDIISFTVKRILIEHRLQLIGFPIPGGIYLGPLFYYLVSVPYLLAGLNPQNLYIFSAIFGTLTTFLVFKVGSTIFEKRSIGILASIIYSFSYLSIVYSKILTGLTFGPILTLMTYLLVYKSIKEKSEKYLIPLSFVLLIASQNEGSSLSLIVLTLIVFTIYKFRVSLSSLLKALFIFVIFHLPLLVFDIRHNFFLSKSFFNFFLNNAESSSRRFGYEFFIQGISIFPNTLSRFLFANGNKNIADQILPCIDLVNSRLTSINFFSFLLAIIIISFFIFSIIVYKKENIGKNILLSHFSILFIGLLVYNFFLGSYFYEWVLVVFFPAFSFLAAYFLDYFQKNIVLKIIVYCFLIFFVYYNVNYILKTNSDHGLANKVEAVKYASSRVKNKEFYLESLGSCYQTGYVYLFSFFNNPPTQSYADDYFTPTFYKRNNSSLKTKVVIANPSESETTDYYVKYKSYKEKAKESERFGNIEVLLVEEEGSFK